MRHWKTISLCITIALSLPGCGGSSSSAAPSQQSQNKELVRQFYTNVIGQNNTALVSTLFAADYVQHDPSVPNGPAGQITLVQNMRAQMPGMVATIKHIGAEGDYVLVHWHMSATPANEASGFAVADLYRMSNGKIAEHWDTFQNVPATTPSGNSMFSDLYVYPQPKPVTTAAQEAANKQMVVSAYLGLFNDHNLALLDQYWDPNYLQHNPWAPNGTDGLRQLIQSMPTGGPPLAFFQTIADDDMVYTISLNSMPGPNPGDPVMTHMLTDIFRVAGNKIVEHWDIQ